MKLGSLFSGCGGLDLAVNSVFGSETAWFCEFEDAPSKVLAANWPNVPNHRDVTAVDWSLVEPVDILAGGFPCQDLSLAGRRAGMRPGTRSGLWSDFVKAIDALKPKVVVIENVRGLLSGCAEGGINEDGSPMEPCQGCMGNGEHRPVLRALGRVLGDLANLGYDAEWGGIRAADIGAPHGRFRVFVVAYRHNLGSEWLGYTRDWRSRSENGHSEPVELPDGAFMFSTPDTMPDAPNKNSNRVKQPGGLNDQVMSLFRAPVADEDGAGPNMRDSKGDLMLWPTVTHMLPTPVTSDGAGGPRLDSTPNPHGFALQMRDIAVELGRTNFGQYEPAVRRWEALTRPAPAPTKPDGKNGNHRLSSEFVEWMQGYAQGHVTGHGLTRKQELTILGNTVVPQQGAEAVRQLWTRAMARKEQLQW